VFATDILHRSRKAKATSASDDDIDDIDDEIDDELDNETNGSGLILDVEEQEDEEIVPENADISSIDDDDMFPDDTEVSEEIPEDLLLDEDEEDEDETLKPKESRA
jgi:hypothetical protein